ncbi:MAG TPA: SRPBCC domain-containing protein [Candidatus Dormibacteraeota bacterium]|nr:SRPBCC domain-containing protein [Candidatus Dormibacteraeota bacterium]
MRFVGTRGEAFDGRMITFDPPELMELTWGDDRLRIHLEPDGDGTVLTLTDSFADLGKAARDAAGWHECLDRLVAHVDQAPAPAWGDRWREIHPVYAERLGPAAATIGPPPG